jgi:hypothetical protein
LTDADGLENGEIDDPGAVATSSSGSSSGGGGGGGGACFIITSASEGGLHAPPVLARGILLMLVSGVMHFFRKMRD